MATPEQQARGKIRWSHVTFAALVFATGVMVLVTGGINYHGQEHIGGRQALVLGILMIVWSAYILYLSVAVRWKSDSVAADDK